MLSFFSSICKHTLTKRNTVSNAPEQAEEMHKGQQNVIISPWNHFFWHYLLVKLIESFKVSSKRHLRETTIAFHQLIDARGSRSYGKGVTSSSIQTFSLQIQSSSCIN